jgi:hypothetical protein
VNAGCTLGQTSGEVHAYQCSVQISHEAQLWACNAIGAQKLMEYNTASVTELPPTPSRYSPEVTYACDVHKSRLADGRQHRDTAAAAALSAGPRNIVAIFFS